MPLQIPNFCKAEVAPAASARASYRPTTLVAMLWTFLLDFLVCLIFVFTLLFAAAALHHATPSEVVNPSGWLHGVEGPWVPKEPVYDARGRFNTHLQLFARRERLVFDLIDNRDETTFVHSLLVVSTFGAATLRVPTRPVFIQPAYIPAHPEFVVCDQGVVIAAEGRSLTLRSGSHIQTLLMPTGCVTEGHGHTIGAYPVIFELPEVQVPQRIMEFEWPSLPRDFVMTDTAWAFSLSAIVAVLIILRPYPTLALLSLVAAYFSATPLMWTAACLAGAYTAYLVVLLSRRIVHQSAQRCPIPINKTKDYFRTITNSVVGVEGEHLRLANWRRILEKACSELFLKYGFHEYRDVGGSRTRRPEESNRKHICSAQNDNDDILRDDKAEHIFYNCRRKGQDCPDRHRIPAAMLSHVDYHLTPKELAEVITGPTFIINHRFGNPGVCGGYGEYSITPEPSDKNDKPKPKTYHEAKWQNNGGVITMTTGDGTPYEHGFNLWKNEGVIMGTHRCASYVRVFQHSDCDVYLAYPANGYYDRAHSGVLERAPILPQELPDGTKYRLKTIREDGKHDKHVVVYELPTGPVQVPAHIPTTIAMGLSTSPRDDKFESSLNSLTQAELRKFSTTMVSAGPVVKIHARMLCDNLSLRIVHDRTLRGFDPLSDGVVRAKAYQLIDSLWFLPRSIQSRANDLLNSRLVLPVAKVIGVVHKVPAYEVFREEMNAELTHTRRNPRFRDQPTPDHASTDGGSEHSTAGQSKQCDSVDRNSSDQSGDAAKPADNGSRVPERDVCDQLAGPSGPPPIAKQTVGNDPPHADGSESHPPLSTRPIAVGTDSGREPGADPLPPNDDCSGSAIQGRYFNFRRAFELAASKGEKLFVVRSVERGPGEPIRWILRMVVSPQLDEGLEEEFHVQRPMQEVECRTFIRLLQILPRVPLAHLRCVVRCAVRAVGVSMSSCGNDGHSSDCFGIRVLDVASNGVSPQGYTRHVISGMGYEIPSGKTARIDAGKTGYRLVGPEPKGCKSRCLPQVGDHHENDRPTEYFAEIGPNVNHLGPSDIGDRTRAGKTDQQKQKGPKDPPRAPKSGKGSRSKRKGRGAR